uniref:Uncharacterized protein n=1 Tax=Arundo donax TaxID=35708 RepID=A0A0A8YDK3_ARUDO
MMNPSNLAILFVRLLWPRDKARSVHRGGPYGPCDLMSYMAVSIENATQIYLQHW